ncbi:hypothetical protein [uncultured Duncaniella sp.]|uniref:hypothetical protein n=1 Tax=uncultured Duncaniella sp. TaxID=2768039 RepID=UPI0025A9CE20|nr:hypothetical protein [uncultured Duncaniella sp.]
MKKSLTTESIVIAHNSLKGARLTRLDTQEKFTVIRAMRALRPVASSLQEFIEDAREKLRPEDWDNIQHKAERFDTLTEEEKREVNATMEAYNADVARCIGEEASKEQELEFEPLTEEAFGRLLDSNDLDISTIIVLQDVLCE